MNQPGRLYDFGITVGAFGLLACALKAGFLVVKGYLPIWKALLCFVWSGAIYGVAAIVICVAGWALTGGRDRVSEGYWWAALLLAYGVLWLTWECLA